MRQRRSRQHCHDRPQLVIAEGGQAPRPNSLWPMETASSVVGHRRQTPLPRQTSQQRRQLEDALVRPWQDARQQPNQWDAQWPRPTELQRLIWSTTQPKMRRPHGALRQPFANPSSKSTGQLDLSGGTIVKGKNHLSRSRIWSRGSILSRRTIQQ